MQQRRCQSWRLDCFRFAAITIEDGVHLSAGDRDATADGLIILRSAGLVVGEWKTSARGLTGDELDKLWKAADQVGARAHFRGDAGSSPQLRASMARAGRAQRSAALRTDCRATVRPAADRSQWQSRLASANHDLFEPRDDYPTPVASRDHLGQKRSTKRSATTSKARRPTTDSCAVRRGWPPTSSTRRSCRQALTTTPARNRFSSGHVRGGFDRSWVLRHSREPHHGQPLLSMISPAVVFI